MRLQMWIAVGFVAMLASACAIPEDGGRTDSPGGIPVVYDSSVPSDQRTAINGDLTRLASMQISDNSNARVVGLQDFSSSALVEWLKKRLKYITGESFNVKSNTVAQQSSYYYRPQLFASVSSFAATTVVTRMTNIGAGAYLDGMNSNQISAMRVAGEKIVVTSPRVGIFQVGEGLFANSSSSSSVNSLNRLSTLFHEARHTDGNGDHVAFPHQTCPSWHDYSGSYACDNATNGPYSIQYILLKKFAASCADCTTKDKEVLSTLVADRISRVLPGASEKDATPERISQ